MIWLDHRQEYIVSHLPQRTTRSHSVLSSLSAAMNGVLRCHAPRIQSQPRMRPHEKSQRRQGQRCLRARTALDTFVVAERAIRDVRRWEVTYSQPGRRELPILISTNKWRQPVPFFLRWSSQVPSELWYGKRKHYTTSGINKLQNHQNRYRIYYICSGLQNRTNGGENRNGNVTKLGNLQTDSSYNAIDLVMSSKSTNTCPRA